MSTQPDQIYFGYFPDFTNPTILFSGTPAAFALFEELFRKFLSDEKDALHLSELQLFARGNVDIVLRLLPKATGMKKINDKSFDWGLSVKEVTLFADELHDFAQATAGAAFHQYLDSEAL